MLLSGIAVCGLCGNGLRSRPRDDGRPCYVCAKDLGGCGKIRIMAKDFEEDVVNRIFSRLDPGQLRQPVAQGPMEKELAELARLETLKKQLAELAGAGDIELAEFRAAKAANDAKIGSLRRALAKSAEEEAQERVRAEAVDLQAKWDELDVEDRRRVVQALAKEIVVGSARRGQNFYGPERVKVTYR